MKEEIGKRKKKHTARWLEYQSSQLDNHLLYSSKNVDVVKEQMLQVDDIFKMVTEVHNEYNVLLPVEQQEQNEDCF